MNKKPSGRRRFLQDSTAMAGAVLGAQWIAKAETTVPDSVQTEPKEWRLHAYGERSHFETAVRYGQHKYGTIKPGVPTDMTGGPRTPLQDLTGTITPAPLHFIVSALNEPPDIDPRQHRFMIHGMVDRPLIFTMEELKRLPAVSRVHFLNCRGNSNPSNERRRLPQANVAVTHGLTSSSEWTGVPLSLLLKEAGLQKAGSWIVAEGFKHTKSIPIEKALDDCLVAYGQNAEAVRPEQGYPLRLVVPGWQGINNVKWLRRIKVVDGPYMGKRESTDYAEPMRPDGKAVWFNVELGPYSVITRPSGGQQLTGRGYYEITGLAWSGGGTIQRVEVSTDGGKTWIDAKVEGPVHRKAHTRFRLDWNWTGEETLLRSRSTDERGQVQPTVAELAKTWGRSPDYYQSPPPLIIGNFNAIQTWKVTREGGIENELFS